MMWFIGWALLSSYIFGKIFKKYFHFLPGSYLMIFLVCFSGSLILSSLLGFGPNFWQGRFFSLPAVLAMAGGIFFYALTWYCACNLLARADQTG